MRVYFFGCRGRPGHYLQRADGYHEHWSKRPVPWTDNELDTYLAPKGRPQKQGPALVHHRNGWTALAFWDRTGDGRGNSNSAVIAEGTHDFGAMVTIMQEQLPWLAERLTFELTEATELENRDDHG